MKIVLKKDILKNWVLYLFLFITLTFPKAGAVIRDMPITVPLIMFAVLTIIYVLGVFKGFVYIRNYLGIYILYVFWGVSMFLIKVFSWNTMSFVFLVMIIFSPLAISLGVRLDYNISMKIIALALFIVSAYAIMQYTIGLEKTMVQGLTISLGEDYAGKPIGRWEGTTYVLQKVPSTYQNGNLAAPIYILMIGALLSWKNEESKRFKLKKVSIIFGVLGLYLTGARSYILPFTALIIYILYLLYRQIDITQRGKFILFIFLGILFLVIYTAFFNKSMFEFMWNRYIVRTLASDGDAGRSLQYANFFRELGKQNFAQLIFVFLFGFDWSITNDLEGYLNIFSRYGLVMMILFIDLLVMLIKYFWKQNDKIFSMCVIVTVIGMAMDNPFFYPPVLINYFMIVGIMISGILEKSKKKIKKKSIVRQV